MRSFINGVIDAIKPIATTLASVGPPCGLGASPSASSTVGKEQSVGPRISAARQIVVGSSRPARATLSGRQRQLSYFPTQRSAASHGVERQLRLGGVGHTDLDACKI